MDKAKFEQERHRLFAQWGLLRWRFKYSSAKRQLGLCDYRKQRISVSLLHVELDSEEVVLDTLKHEIAHALAGAGKGHGEEFKEWARKVGCTEDACGATTTKITQKKGRWQAFCAGCKDFHHRHKKPKYNSYRCVTSETEGLKFEDKTVALPIPKKSIFDR